MRPNAVKLDSPRPDDPEARLAALLGDVAAGDERAFARLSEALHGEVLGFSLRLLGRYDRAEEVANDAMLAIWHGADAFEGRSKVRTWAFGITYRIALRARRRFGFEMLHRSLDAILERSDPSAPGADALIGTDRMTDAIAVLAPEARALVHMTYYYGYTAREVGEVTGLPEGTVKTRLAAARRRMGAHLGTGGGGE